MSNKKEYIPILKCPCCEKATLYFEEGKEESVTTDKVIEYFRRAYIKCTGCSNIIELGKIHIQTIGMI